MGHGGYKSLKQKRWMRQNQPELAKRWDKHYGKLLDTPKHKAARKKGR